MANNAVQHGDVVPFTAPSGGVVSGQGILIGAFFVIPSVSATDGERFNGHLCGVWELPKTAANTPAEGALAYWNAAAGEVTTTASGNSLIGAFTEARGNGDTTAYVRLNGVAIV